MIVNRKVSNTSMRKYSLYLETTFIIRYNAIWLKDRSYLNITMRQSRQSGVASPGIITIHVRRQLPPTGAATSWGLFFLAWGSGQIRCIIHRLPSFFSFYAKSFHISKKWGNISFKRHSPYIYSTFFTKITTAFTFPINVSCSTQFSHI